MFLLITVNVHQLCTTVFCPGTGVADETHLLQNFSFSLQISYFFAKDQMFDFFQVIVYIPLSLFFFFEVASASFWSSALCCGKKHLCD
jgi:hypothetical protein